METTSQNAPKADADPLLGQRHRERPPQKRLRSRQGPAGAALLHWPSHPSFLRSFSFDGRLPRSFLCFGPVARSKLPCRAKQRAKFNCKNQSPATASSREGATQARYSRYSHQKQNTSRTSIFFPFFVSLFLVIVTIVTAVALLIPYSVSHSPVTRQRHAAQQTRQQTPLVLPAVSSVPDTGAVGTRPQKKKNVGLVSTPLASSRLIPSLSFSPVLCSLPLLGCRPLRPCATPVWLLRIFAEISDTIITLAYSFLLKALFLVSI